MEKEYFSMKKHLPGILSALFLLVGLAACGSSTASAPPVGAGPADTIAAAQGAAEKTGTPAASVPPTLRPTNTLPPSLTLTPTQDLSAPDCLRAAFVADVTIPDGRETAPGTAFVKTWQMQNTGTCAWDSSYALVFDHGERMDAPDSTPLAAGQVAPGETADISVNLTAPKAEGSYQAFFKIRAPSGAAFGIGADADTAFWVKITVTAGSKPPSAAPKIEYTSDVVTVKSRSRDPFNVACPGGTLVTGGGFHFENDGLYIFGEYKENNGWTVVPDSVVSYDIELTVYAICMTLPGADTSQYFETFAVPRNSTVTDSIECPAGAVVTGGGFSKNLGGLLMITRNSRYLNGWQVTARNNYSNDGLVYVNVVCLSGAALASTSASGSAEIAPDGDGYAQAACPAGTVMSGVGWSFGDAYLKIFSVIPHGAAWRIRAVNLLGYGDKARLAANGVCLGVP
jgi:hypothetical protein